MISYCGLNCSTCPIHLATLETDESRKRQIREEIAGICNKKYRMNIKADDVTDCDGCLSDSGRLFSGCLNCQVRICAIRKKVENCRFCSDYICDRLKPVKEAES